jgi:hypothetical protein
MMRESPGSTEVEFNDENRDCKRWRFSAVWGDSNLEVTLEGRLEVAEKFD